MRILYVENHPSFARIAARQFLCAFEVVITPSLALAREALAQGAFEFVLLDYDLDDGKGAELMPDLQRLAPRPFVVAVSSHQAGNEAIMAAGADAQCSKMHFAKIEAVLQSLPLPRSPLGIPGVNLRLSSQEIVDFVREDRERV